MRVHRHGLVGLVGCVALLAALLSVAGSPPPAGAAVAPGFELAWGSSGTGNGQFDRPTAVASGNGIVYVVDAGNDRVQGFDANGAYLGQLGSTGSGNGQFIDPSGVAVGPDGSVYVADTGNQRIQRLDAVGNFVASWGGYGAGNGQFNFPSAVAVDPVSGNVFVADTLNHRVQKFTASGTYKTQWGRQGTANGRFDTPAAVAVSADRKVYVADGGNDRVQQFTGTGVFQRQWGATGTSDGRFDDPSGVAVDSTGRVFVADSANHRVQQFSATGAFQATWGQHGAANGQFTTPIGVGIAADGLRILVADTFNHRVQRFAPVDLPGAQPVFAGTWGSTGAGNGHFSFPHGIAVDVVGTVYVADAGNHRVQEFTSTGFYLAQWGTNGNGDGQFTGPRGVAVNSVPNVFVADTTNDRIQKFTADGTFLLTQWGSTGTGNSQFDDPWGVAVDSVGDVYVADSGNDRVQKFSSSGGYLTQWGASGAAAGQFAHPSAVAADRAGNVYVADQLNDRVQKFTATGVFLTQWGTAGTGAGQFNDPIGIAVDPNGSVYVADSGNDRVQKFSSSGAYLTQWGVAGTGNGQFSSPFGVATDPVGNVYVTDSLNHRVQRFTVGVASSPVVSLSADQSSVSPGEPIDYHVTVTNTTAATLTGVRITDPRAPDCEGPVANLAPAASVVVDCTYNTGADDAGPYANTATLDSDQTNAIVSNTVTTQVGPAVTVTVTAPSEVMATEEIEYSIGITNNSALPLTSVRVNDPAVPGCAGPIADIAPGATANVNCSKPTTDAESGSTVVNVVGVDASGAQAGFSSAVTRVQGRVTGTVSGPGGPVAGAYVMALSRDFLPLQGDAVADGSGVFSLGLDPGRYYLAFADPSGAHVAEYYNNKFSVAQLTASDLVTVEVGSGPATVNVPLGASGFPVPANPAAVAGTVTDANGPVAGVWVVAIHFGLGGIMGATRTDAAGEYSVGGLPAGNIYLEFADPSGTHAFEWFHDSDGSNPTPTVLTAGQTTSNVDETLAPYP